MTKYRDLGPPPFTLQAGDEILMEEWEPIWSGLIGTTVAPDDESKFRRPVEAAGDVCEPIGFPPQVIPDGPDSARFFCPRCKHPNEMTAQECVKCRFGLQYPPPGSPMPEVGEDAAFIEDHPWPNCGEVQCKQAHLALNAILELLEHKCPDNIYVVGKAVRISGEITALHQRIAEIERENDDWKATATAMQVSRDAAVEELQRVREVLKALVNRLKFVHNSDEYKGVWFAATVHSGVYRGPKYDTELRAAQAALKEVV